MQHRPRSGRFDLRWLGGAVLGGLLLTVPAGCGGEHGGTAGKRAEGQTAAANAANASNASNASDIEWAWLQSAKKTLDAQRGQLAQAAPPPALAKEVAARGEELDRRLIDFINANPPAEGEKPAGRLLDALRMKSDEDIALAHQFIGQGGDYRRAIEIYEAALAIDPDNPRLKEELGSARAHRYMTAERFSQVKKGMTQDEVRELLGQPNVRDVRDFPERGVTAWFYTRDADGRAAAVWFAREKGGAFAVYMADFDAVGLQKPPAP